MTESIRINKKTNLDNPFMKAKARYTPEQLKQFEHRDRTKKEALETFSSFYGEHIANAIVFNVMVEYRNIFGRFSNDFYEAWKEIGLKTSMDIVYRLVNGLPVRERNN